MKILLTTLNTKYVHTNIALRYLQNALKEKLLVENDKQLEVIRKEFSINDLVENILAAITDIKADIIAFSVYIWNVEMVLKLTKEIKKVQPNVILILGGPEVSYRSKEILEENKNIDFVCVGEGEEAFPILIQELTKPGSQKTTGFQTDMKKLLPSLTYRSTEGIIEGTLAVVEDVTKIPRISKEIAEEYDGKIVYIETVRGCPYSCSYCLSSTIKGIRPFPMERVKEELKILMDRKVKLIKFVDRTFNYDKKRALEIWQFILAHNLSSQFHFELSAHLIDEEMMDFLRTVPKDVFKFEIGVQSTNSETIFAIHRTTDFKILSNRVKQLAEMQTISLHLDLIAGLPYEGLESFQKSFDDVYALKPTELQLGFLKMLSGTVIRKEEEKFHYVYTSYPPYEVLQNDFLSYEEIKELKRIETVFDFYYNSMRFQHSLSFLLEKNDSAFLFYQALANYYYQNGFLERKISVEEQYDILAKFYQEVVAANGKAKPYEDFIQYLKYDFVLHFNTKRDWMPKYDAKWVKKMIDEKVQEMIQYQKEENIYKTYKFEIFEIDFATGEKKQNLWMMKRN